MRPLAFGLTLIVATPLASAATGFLKGERVSGMNKVCVYDVLGSPYTVNVPAAKLCPLTVDAPNPAPRPSAPRPSVPSYEIDPPRKTGFLKGEVTEGMNKVCYYDVLGSMHTYTINAVSLCPLSKKF